MSGLGLTFLRRGGQAHPSAGSDYIRFKDEAVFNLLMSKGISSDGIGITKDDAAKVSSIDTWFQNSNIQSFSEFQYFTGVTSLIANAFAGSTITEIILPPQCISLGQQSFISSQLEDINLNYVTNIGAYAIAKNNIQVVNAPNLLTLDVGNFHSCPLLEKIEDLGRITSVNGGTTYATAMCQSCHNLQEVHFPDSLLQMSGIAIFGDCVNLKKCYMSANITTINVTNFAYINAGSSAVHLDVIMKGANPPTINSNFLYRRSDFTIYVPDSAVSAYKAAPIWANFATKIKGISEYNG